MRHHFLAEQPHRLLYPQSVHFAGVELQHQVADADVAHGGDLLGHLRRGAQDEGMLQAFAGGHWSVGVWWREAAGVVEFAGAAEVGALPLEPGGGDFQRFVVAVRHE